METKQVAERLVELCRQGQWDQPYNELYSPEIVSVEMSEPMRECHGIDEVRRKGDWFGQMYEIEDPEVLGPYVNENRFAVHFTMTMKSKENGETSRMEEIALYEVRDGKIVHETFFG